MTYALLPPLLLLVVAAAAAAAAAAMARAYDSCHVTSVTWW